MEITDEGRKRLLQAGFLAGLRFLDAKYNDITDEKVNEIKESLGSLFEDYGLSKEIV